MVPLERLHFADVSEGNRKKLKSIGFALLTDKRVDGSIECQLAERNLDGHFPHTRMAQPASGRLRRNGTSQTYREPRII
jgi:hypothetical protein